MGDRVDALNLPEHEQSGNMSVGQVSTINLQERQDAAGELNAVLEQYYTLEGGLNFNTVLPEIENLGYTTERAEQIRRDAQIERTLRLQNDGNPSNLTPNQLEFVNTSHRELLSGQSFHVLTDDDGRQYVHDFRVREVDGSPARLYLPAPEPFNPLTLIEQQEQAERIADARPDFVLDFNEFNYPEYTGSLSRNNFSDGDLSTINHLSIGYLNNPNQDTLNQLRDGIEALTDARYVRNGDSQLNQFLNDIQYEAQHRRENNGLPQLISQEQFDELNNNPDYRYNGGLIYRSGNTLYYYDNVRGTRRAVPELDEDGNVERTNLTPDQINLPSSITRTIGGVESFDPSSSVRYDRQALNREEQDALTSDMISVINGETTYRQFLNTINTEFSLSNRQFIDVSDYVLRNSITPIPYEEANLTGYYTDEPVFVYVNPETGRTSSTTREEVFRQAFSSDVDNPLINQQIIQIQNRWRATNYAVRTSARINPNLDPENNVITQIQSGHLNPQLIISGNDLQRPQPIIIPPQDTIPNEPFERERDPDRTVVQDILSQLARGGITRPAEIYPQLEGITGQPPIVPGTTRAVDPVSQEEYVVPTPQERVDRYERYFNNNQLQYEAFRQTFRDLIPLFTGAAGGYFAFSYARSRDRGTIQEILNQERDLLDRLQIRMDNELDRVSQTKQQLDISSQELVEAEGELSRVEARETSSFSSERMRGDILRNKERTALTILRQIEDAENDLDNLEMDIASQNIQRTEINNRIDNLINEDRLIMQEINRYNPQILTGISIGTTLGLVLSGYFFPTYVDIDDNEEFITADNINYNPKKDKENKESNKRQKPKKPFNIQEPSAIKYGNNQIRMDVPKMSQGQFRPMKNKANGQPLTYREIQEYKATLNSQELNNLKGNFLIFGASDKVVMKESSCKNVVGETIINKRKVY